MRDHIKQKISKTSHIADGGPTEAETQVFSSLSDYLNSSDVDDNDFQIYSAVQRGNETLYTMSELTLFHGVMFTGRAHT